MFGLGRLVGAIARLSGAVEGLAETGEAVNQGLRQRFALDAPAAVPEPEALEDRSEPAARRNGKAKAGT